MHTRGLEQFLANSKHAGVAFIIKALQILAELVCHYITWSCRKQLLDMRKGEIFLLKFIFQFSNQTKSVAGISSLRLFLVTYSYNFLHPRKSVTINITQQGRLGPQRMTLSVVSNEEPRGLCPEPWGDPLSKSRSEDNKTSPLFSFLYCEEEWSKLWLETSSRFLSR